VRFLLTPPSKDFLTLFFQAFTGSARVSSVTIAAWRLWSFWTIERDETSRSLTAKDYRIARYSSCHFKPKVLFKSTPRQVFSSYNAN